MSKTLEGTNLRLPFYLNIRGMSAEQVDGTVDFLLETTGAKLFRDRELFDEVLQDRVRAANDPRKFLNGPYLKVLEKNSGEIRLGTVDEVSREEGGTVYALDQLQAELTPLAAPRPRESTLRPR